MNAPRSKHGAARISSRRTPRLPSNPGPRREPSGVPVKRVLPLALILAVASVSLSGCGNMLERISEAGKTPAMTPIENPNAQPDYHPVTMPMPAPMTDVRQANSLWRQGSRTFFADQRASKVGDILTSRSTIGTEFRVGLKEVTEIAGRPLVLLIR